MKEIISNIAGFVINCGIKVGDTINEGDTVLLVESMKMEIPVESELSGQVTEVLVNEGDEVEEGQRLAILV